ncbi:MAG: alpha/beta hydrolase, partial [Pseudomonadota bacterium]
MDKVISKDGTPIAWKKAGSGPPLVLVDGALCYTEAGATPGMLPVLQSHFTVYVWDRRGRGQSGNTLPWSPQKEIEDLAAICALCPEPPIVCGFSSGAALTLYAGAAGLNARRLVLFEAPFVVVDDSDPKPPVDALQQLQGFIRAGDNK